MSSMTILPDQEQSPSFCLLRRALFGILFLFFSRTARRYSCPSCDELGGRDAVVFSVETSSIGFPSPSSISLQSPGVLAPLVRNPGWTSDFPTPACKDQAGFVVYYLHCAVQFSDSLSSLFRWDRLLSGCLFLLSSGMCSKVVAFLQSRKTFCMV